MTSAPSAEIVATRRLVARARADLLQVEESLTRFDDSATEDEQALRLAAAVEAVRAARAKVDAACLQLADAAMILGASPRLLDWSDGTSE